MNTSFTNLSVSIKSANVETANFILYLDRNIFNLVFYPNILDADLAFDNYCKLLKSIKNYAANLPTNQDTIEIITRLGNLPSFEEKDFRFYSSSIPAWLLYIILPFGIIMWVNYYFKIASLSEKLRNTDTQLGTIDFFLTALIN